MENDMNDLLLVGAGVGGVLVAIIHGYLGHKIVLPQLAGGTAQIRRVNEAVFQLSTLYWLAGGLVLIATPYFLDDALRRVFVCGVVFLYATGAIGNFWATRGRHPGWVILLVVTIMALLGA